MVVWFLRCEVVLCSSGNRVYGGNENGYSELCSRCDSCIQNAVVCEKLKILVHFLWIDTHTKLQKNLRFLSLLLCKIVMYSLNITTYFAPQPIILFLKAKMSKHSYSLLYFHRQIVRIIIVANNEEKQRTDTITVPELPTHKTPIPPIFNPTHPFRFLTHSTIPQNTHFTYILSISLMTYTHNPNQYYSSSTLFYQSPYFFSNVCFKTRKVLAASCTNRTYFTKVFYVGSSAFYAESVYYHSEGYDRRDGRENHKER